MCEEEAPNVAELLRSCPLRQIGRVGRPLALFCRPRCLRLPNQ
jgi:hypothetical protein